MFALRSHPRLKVAPMKLISSKSTQWTYPALTMPSSSFLSEAFMATNYKLPENFNLEYYYNILDKKNLLSLDKLQVNYVNGEWVTSKDTFPVYDPATEEAIAYMPNLNLEEVKYAIECANQAFPSYSSLTMKERHDIIIRWSNLLRQYSQDLAQILTLENGKVAFESNTEINFAANLFEWFGEQCRGIDGTVIPPSVSGKRFFTYKQAVGVCSIILPWNVPIAMFARKVGAALAVGCTVIVKASSETPLSAIAIAKLGEMAGLPKGVLNVITTAHSNIAQVGEELCTNPLVKKVSFTGSGNVGKIIMKQASDTVKKLSLELGGNAPFIICDDCDIDAAVDGLITCKFRNGGQTCVCANRAFIHKSIFDKFTAALMEKVSNFEIGPGYKQDISLGPLINSKAVKKCKDLVDQAVSQGAKVIYNGGEDFAKKNFPKGFFFTPTVIDCRGIERNKLRFFKEEIFGPILSLYEFENDDEVIKASNSTVEGLASYVYTNSINRSIYFSEKLHYGLVGLNAALLSYPEIPFGGVKESGSGREGSRVGMEDFMETKLVCLGGQAQ